MTHSLLSLTDFDGLTVEGEQSDMPLVVDDAATCEDAMTVGRVWADGSPVLP